MLMNITPVNGFDRTDQDHARQNNYAWSMAEFNGYMYVGTGRNIAALGLAQYQLAPLDSVTPEQMVNLGEIWRYPIGKGKKHWERVYTAEEPSKIYGFRDMIAYEDKNGVNALCISGPSLDKSAAYVLYSTDGESWERMSTEMPAGYNSRAFQIFKGVLYCGTNNTLGGEQATLLATDSYADGLKAVTLPAAVVGNIMSLAEMNGYLYIGTASGKGFSVWKSQDPASGEWTLVVDNGAGDALNEWAMTMMPFNGYLYVGSAITGGIISVDPEKQYVPFKGFDLIRIDADDNWELIVGGDPIHPSVPSKGKRGKSRYSSGFGNAFNCYCWQMHEYNGRLYLSSWDAALLYKDVIVNEIKNGILSGLGLDEDSVFDLAFLAGLVKQIGLTEEHYRWLDWIIAVAKSLPRYPREHGFDLYSTRDGKHFCTETLDGFSNPENYGLRTMTAASDGKLYFGTANVYEGCEVWTYKNREC